MAQYDYDLFVIGAGSGGVRAARLAAMAGAKVGVAESYRVGGTCVIRGCVPKKFMVYASEFAREFELAAGYGWTVGEAHFDWRAFLANKDKEIARISGIYTRNLNNAGVDLILGSASFVDPHTLELTERGKTHTVTAAKILIATGGRPKLPDVPGIEHVITSNEAFNLPRLPKRMVIVGGGYIAVEFACIFHGLGVDVTLIYRGANILRGFDEDVRSHLVDEMNKRGLKVLLSCSHERIEMRPDGVLVSHFGEGLPVEADVVMFATGREPNVEGLGLDKAGVKLNDQGAVAVDDYSRTNVEHIWAVGDVTDRLALTPVAIREAAAFAQTVFYDRPTRFDHGNVPTAVFSQPPIGAVGLTEAEARHQYKQIDIYLTRFRPMRLAFVADDERILMKLVVDRASGRVLGCHIVGHDGPEMIQLAAIAVKAGLTKAQWDDTCALHPTAAEELVTLREPYRPQELVAAE
ncbi:MAG TPA: glutathione-disulfide reductase [Caulobacteraceae bacterium]|jgi:glutathione reductase (NADPH)|nr:glutathione-disulfide reductase [Caulobacteraceae bacterium]